MSIDFTPGIINTYHGDIYNRTTDTDNVKTPDTPMWPCDNQEEQQPINFHCLKKDITLNNLI